MLSGKAVTESGEERLDLYPGMLCHVRPVWYMLHITPMMSLPLCNCQEPAG